MSDRLWGQRLSGLRLSPLPSDISSDPCRRHTPDTSASIGDRVKGLGSLKATSTGPTNKRGHAFNPGRRRIHAILGLFAVACLVRRPLAGPAQRPEEAGHGKKAKYGVNSPPPGVERVSPFICGP